VSERDDTASEDRVGWAVPASGHDESGLSWEGEGLHTRSRTAGGPRSQLWRTVLVLLVALLLAGFGLVLARGTSSTAAPAFGTVTAAGGQDVAAQRDWFTQEACSRA
jgi:hypothetical protein